MARAIRADAGSYSPHELYEASLGHADIYNHAMREAGFVVPTDTRRAPRICDLCGYDFGSGSPRKPVAEVPKVNCACYGLGFQKWGSQPPSSGCSVVGRNQLTAHPPLPGAVLALDGRAVLTMALPVLTMEPTVGQTAIDRVSILD